MEGEQNPAYVLLSPLDETSRVIEHSETLAAIRQETLAKKLDSKTTIQSSYDSRISKNPSDTKPEAHQLILGITFYR